MSNSVIRLFRGVSLMLVMLFTGSAFALEPIRIGAFLAVTGPASYLGEPELETLQLYIDKLNAAGGVLGRKLELIHYDTQGKAGEARTAVKRLILQDKVDMLIGGSTSGSSMAVIPLVERAQIPLISLAGAGAIVDPVKPWVFKTPHTDRMAVAKVFSHMRDQGMQRIALISGRGGFGRSGRRQALDQAEQYGIQIVADEMYKPRALQVDRQLNAIEAAGDIDAVFNIGFGEGPVMVTRQVRAQFGTIPLYQSHGVASARYIELSGQAAEGVRLPAAPLLISEQLPLGSRQQNVLSALQYAYQSRYQRQISAFGGHAYDALMLFVQAVRDAQTLNPFAIRHALERIRGYVGTGGVVNMSPEDHLGLGLDSFKMLEIRGGQWVLAE